MEKKEEEEKPIFPLAYSAEYWMPLASPSVKKAFEKGYLSAKFHYRVVYKCYVCGKILEVHTPDARRVAAKYMEEHGWAHTSCLEKSK